MTPFNIVVAMDPNRGIGKDGRLPWHLKGDLRHFREITTTTRDKNKRNAVIMGRRTWDSLPDPFRPLPGRINVVITRNEQLRLPEGVLKAGGLALALELLDKKEVRETCEMVFVIGGAQIYDQAVCLKECQAIFLTQILNSFPCDTFFPPFADHFREGSVSPRHKEGLVEYFFAEYHRKTSGRIGAA
ncbi:MAG: dihydrofolate reductase [Candidatus Omnitrophica bacterium]|nr:dihydrofolate reductase [Candidatus Omnitrophota bacterium]